MRNLLKLISSFALSMFVLNACNTPGENYSNHELNEPFVDSATIDEKMHEFAEVQLPDLGNGVTSVNKLLFHLKKVGDWTDSIFWLQTYGNPYDLCMQYTDTSYHKLFKLHYGPFDRFRLNEPLVAGTKYKAFGANFYPSDITFPEYLQLQDSLKESPTTVLVRNKEGKLEIISYMKFYRKEIDSIRYHIHKASQLSEPFKLNIYLNEIYKSENIFENLKADSIYTHLTNNPFEFYFGLYTVAEDGFLRKKKAVTSFLLLRDDSFIKKRVRTEQRFKNLLTYFYQENKFDKNFISENRIGIYDAIFYKGQINAGSKLISVFMPPSEVSIKANGSKILLIKNIMYSKFEKILMPIHSAIDASNTKIDDSFELFMLYNLTFELVGASEYYKSSRSTDTQTGSLIEYYNTLYSLRSDIATMQYMQKLYNDELLSKQELNKVYAIYIADVIRNIRFGLNNEQSMALLVELNFIISKGGISYNIDTKSLQVNESKIFEAFDYLDRETKVLFNHGDDQMAARFVNKYGTLTNPIKDILLNVNKLSIPRDVYLVDKN